MSHAQVRCWSHQNLVMRHGFHLGSHPNPYPNVGGIIYWAHDIEMDRSSVWK
jgi:hypothetical protein